jgi:hypothetical protein
MKLAFYSILALSFSVLHLNFAAEKMYNLQLGKSVGIAKSTELFASNGSSGPHDRTRDSDKAAHPKG